VAAELRAVVVVEIINQGRVKFSQFFDRFSVAAKKIRYKVSKSPASALGLQQSLRHSICILSN
jgi:hypothetical protein